MNVFELFASLKLDDKEFEKGLTDAEKKANRAGEAIGTGLKKGASLVTGAVKGVGVIAAGAAATITPLVKSATDAYGETQQLIGGIETLFKGDADKLSEYARNAYKTAGISANDYMEQTIGISASLIQGLGGDTSKAADIANMAIVDMSDNVNKMGTTMESVQNAYSGLARQNFTMLDNLKIGYQGTAEEMARLINDTGVMGDEFEATAKNVKDISFDKYIEAIHKAQTEIGITGTTAAEATGTITGSVGQVKAAWENLVAGLANPDADLGTLIDNVVETGRAALDNLKPTILQAIRGITELIKAVVPIIVEELPTLVNELLPPFLEVTFALISEIAKIIPKYIPLIIEKVKEIVPLIGQAITDSFPKLSFIGDHLEGIIKTIIGVFTGAKVIGGIMSFVSAISAIVPVITGALIPALLSIAPVVLPIIAVIGAVVAAGVLLYKNWDTIKEKAGELADNISEKWSAFKEKASEVWGGIKDSVVNSIGGKAISAAFGALKTTVSNSFAEMKAKYEEYGGGFTGTMAAAMEGVKQYFTSGFNFLDNLTGGKLSDMLSSVKEKMTSIKDNISNGWNVVKNVTSTVWSNIKNNVEQNGGGIRGIIATQVNGYKNLWQTGFDAINRITGGKLDSLRNAFSNFSTNAMNLFSNLWDGIRNSFNISDVFNWGWDMISNFVDGFRSGWSYLKDALGRFGQMIADRIGFSEPKEGVLSNFHTYAPDMMDLFIKGIKDNTDKLQAQLDKSFNFEPTINANASSASGIQSGTVVNMPINIYGAQGQDIRELADIIEQRINHNYNVLSSAYGVG